MRWYNVNEEDKIQSKGIAPIKSIGLQTSQSGLASSKAALGEGSQSQDSNFDWGSLTDILTTGIKVSGTVKAQRAASGRSAERQARIEACGRKGLGYFFSRKKKDEYRKCVESANTAPISGSNQTIVPPPPKSNTMLFVGLGAVVVIGAIAYFVIRKK